MQQLSCSNSKCPCNNPQPVEEFYIRSNSKRGYFSRCKTCTLSQTSKRDRRSEKQKFRDELLSSGFWLYQRKECLFKGNPQPIENFRIKRTNTKTGRVGYHSYCKICEKIRIEESVKTKIDWINSYLQDYSCISCGIDDYRILEFHHINKKNKYNGVARMIRSASLDRNKAGSRKM